MQESMKLAKNDSKVSKKDVFHIAVCSRTYHLAPFSKPRMKATKGCQLPLDQK